MDFLEAKSKGYKGTNFEDLMGKCFNDHLYFQMCKGFLSPSLLEALNTHDLFGSFPLLAPCLQIRSSWDDPDFKQNYQQIFANLHDVCSLQGLKTPPVLSPDLVKFYSEIGIDVDQFQESQQKCLSNWGIREDKILQEIDRQELPPLDKLAEVHENPCVTLLFTLRWFNSEFKNQMETSDLVKGLLLPLDQLSSANPVPKARSQNELLTLCYLSFLNSNNYLKSGEQEFLFGDLIQSINQPGFQEQVFLFLGMLKVFFPGGDPLQAPLSLSAFSDTFSIKQSILLDPLQKELGISQPQDHGPQITLLSRVFCLFGAEHAGVDLQKKPSLDLTQLDFDIAMFCCYLDWFKQTWRTYFQGIIFRAFRNGRASLANCQKVV